MKKITSTFATAITIFLITSIGAHAQKNESNFSLASISIKPIAIPGEEKIKTEVVSPGTTEEEKLRVARANVRAAETSLKAIKASNKAAQDFNKHFEGVQDAKWSNDGELLIASFIKDDEQTEVWYDKKGFWKATIKYYGETKMPASVKRLINSTYPKYKITGVQDIIEGPMNFQVVHLEDCTSFKKVVVYENEVGVYKEYNKL
jgi:hypothetical protein